MDKALQIKAQNNAAHIAKASNQEEHGGYDCARQLVLQITTKNKLTCNAFPAGSPYGKIMLTSKKLLLHAVVPIS